MKRVKAVSYETELRNRLKDPVYAAKYLNAQLLDDDDLMIDAFLLALRDVAVAHGMTKVSKKSALGRESLYKALSKNGNPKVATLQTLLKSMGLKLVVEPKTQKRRKAS